MKITFKGTPVVLSGQPLKEGDKLPNVQLLDTHGQDVKLHDLLQGQLTILSVVPDVMTRTCELQTKHLAEATKDKGVQFYTVSRNSVEEFQQWNQEHGLDVKTLSDSQGEFGQAVGISIELAGKEVLTRSVYVVDKDLTIRYVQYVAEITEEPDYDSVLEAINKGVE